MDNISPVQEFKGDKNLSDDDCSLDVEQFPVLELDIREEVPSSHKILEDVSEYCQLCFVVDGSAYIELSVTYTFSRPIMLGFTNVSCFAGSHRWHRVSHDSVTQESQPRDSKS